MTPKKRSTRRKTGSGLSKIERRSLRVLITRGPTREPLDAARFISNYSTGYMGALLAAEARSRGHRVTVVSGPSCEPLPRGVTLVKVERASEMGKALAQRSVNADAIIMAAAVSDFCPIRRMTGKLPRRKTLRLTLEATKDLIGNLARRPDQVVVGFAVEAGRILQRARRKLREKRLDLLLAQETSGAGEPFGRCRVRAWLLASDGATTALGMVSKPRVARVLLDKIEALWYGQHMSQEVATGSPCSC